jgi:hypothetical protein
MLFQLSIVSSSGFFLGVLCSSVVPEAGLGPVLPGEGASVALRDGRAASTRHVGAQAWLQSHHD